MKNIIIIAFITIVCSSCELERDNPFDIKSSNYSPTTIKDKETVSPSFKSDVSYSRYIIASKENTSFGDFPPQTINAGETIYLQIYLNNAGSVVYKEVEGEVTTTSSIASILPLTGSNRLIFHNDVSFLNFNSGEGYGDIVNGNSFSAAPNYNSYSVKLKIENNAVNGDVILLNLTAKNNQEVIQSTISLKVN